ncbi:MAG: ATP-binding cassette domain-containing protein [Thaumarchaeota archaeon]|nr:ATP-binding cassette domain-containing protein [Nitrososphaerota archaeon]
MIVEDVHKSFGPVKVLEGVSICIKRGEKIGIVGPNGAGKTTLLRIILGILKPDKGYIWDRIFAKVFWLCSSSSSKLSNA